MSEANAGSNRREHPNRLITVAEITVILAWWMIMMLIIPLPLCAMEGNYLRSQNETATEWDYINCVYYCSTLMTTIGFGDIVPKTDGGRVYSIFMSLASLASFGCIISLFGYYLWITFDKGVDHAADRLVSEKWSDLIDFLKSVRAKFLLVIITFILYWVINAAIFGHIESWRYIDSIYFTYLCLFTIGLGDIVPITTAGRIYFIFFSQFGILIETLLIGYFVEFIISSTRKISTHVFAHDRINDQIQSQLPPVLVEDAIPPPNPIVPQV